MRVLGRALGQTSTSSPSFAYELGITAPSTSSEGTYAGGNLFLDAYCDSEIGQWLDPSYCAVPSTQAIAAEQAAELATTSAPASAQAAALSAGAASVASACTSDPADCAAQEAAAMYPSASAIFSPSLVAEALGIQADGTISLFSGFGIYLAAGLIAIFAFSAMKK
jgi:hypothetical protein